VTEATVSSAFMKQLRERLPDAVVIKHRDASFIGLPDCSITYRKRILWVEFKLVSMKLKWDPRNPPLEEIMAEIVKASPVQHAMMQRLASAGNSCYVVWVKKTGVFVQWPLPSPPLWFSDVNRGHLLDHVTNRLNSMP
jgi:hypothetical protein